MKTIESIGKTVEEAVANGLKELELSQDEVDIDILDEGQKGVFGIFGAKVARVKITEKEPETSPAGRVASFLTTLSQMMGVVDPGIAIAINEREMRVLISGDNVGSLIGHKGETLDAIQMLTGLVVNHHKGESNDQYMRVIMDVANYRKKREETLIHLAQKLATKVRTTGHNMALEPMNSYERRIIHAALHDYKGITTYSEGDEPYRHIVIAID